MTTIFQATFLRETAWICGGYAREKREKLGAVTDTQENGGKIGGCEGCTTLWRENNMASKIGSCSGCVTLWRETIEINEA